MYDRLHGRRMTIPGLAISSAAVALFLSFLAFSFVTDFGHWPWTLTTTYESGLAYGFRMGASKETLIYL